MTVVVEIVGDGAIAAIHAFEDGPFAYEFETEIAPVAVQQIGQRAEIAVVDAVDVEEAIVVIVQKGGAPAHTEVVHAGGGGNILKANYAIFVGAQVE